MKVTKKEIQSLNIFSDLGEGERGGGGEEEGGDRSFVPLPNRQATPGYKYFNVRLLFGLKVLDLRFVYLKYLCR